MGGVGDQGQVNVEEEYIPLPGSGREPSIHKTTNHRLALAFQTKTPTHFISVR